MRSPVTALLEQYKLLTPEEAKVFLDLVDPQPEPEPVKRTRAKRGTGAKSKRATGMAEAIKNSLQAQQPGAADEDEGSEDAGPLCGACGHTADYQDHFKPSPQYHEFDAPKSVARAPRKSKQRPPDFGSSIPNSEIVKDAVTDAALAASGGD
jgi:hypothetical protein